METFFQPKNVAIVGASSTKGKIGYEILTNILKTSINVYPINPKRDEILGISTYQSVDDIDDEIDLAVIAVDPQATLQAIEQCGKKGIHYVVIISGGFREMGNEHLERRILEIANDHNIRIIGPNCIGVFDGETGFNTFFQRHMDMPKFGNVSIITQSGTFGIGLLEKLAQENIGVNKFVSYGNKIDVDELDLLSFFEADLATEVIVLYLEDISKEFFEIDISKPVIILKTGRSKLGQQAAQLHTGALASNYEIFKGVCRQKNILFAEDFYELFDMIKIVAMQGTPKGGSISLITNGAGPSVLTCDFIESSRNLNLKGSVVDLTGSATADDYINAFEKSDADIIILTFVFQDAPLAETLTLLYERLCSTNKFCLAIAIGGTYVAEQRKSLAKCSIPCFEEPRSVIQILDKLVAYNKKL